MGQDQETILSFLSSKTDKKVDIKTWSTDIIDLASYKKVLSEVEKFGEITCVVFNAARDEPSELLKFDESEIVKDFMVSVLLSTLSSFLLSGVLTHTRIRYLSSAQHYPHPIPTS